MTYATRVLLVGTLAAMSIAVPLHAPPAAAQEAPADAWTFRITPYLWASSIQGDIRVFPRLPPAEIDVSFSDILEHLDIAFMATFEAQRGRFGLIADTIYLDVSDSASTPFGLVFSKVDASLAAFIGTAYGAYRIAENEGGAVDLLAGARLFALDLDLDFEAGRFGRDRSFDLSETWVDPVVGLRGRVEIVDGLFFNAEVDFGGYSFDSNFTWQALGGFGYSFDENWELQIGYRHLAVNYDYLGKRNMDADLAFTGPFLGISYSW